MSQRTKAIRTVLDKHMYRLQIYHNAPPKDFKEQKTGFHCLWVQRPSREWSNFLELLVSWAPGPSLGGLASDLHVVGGPCSVLRLGMRCSGLFLPGLEASRQSFAVYKAL